jgi:type II secretory pathway pseudopilin PulG
MTQEKAPGSAVASLVLGILGLVCLGPLAAIPAVICGHVAKSKIKAAAGALQGEQMALVGLILGYIGIGLFVVLIPFFGTLAAIAIPSFMRARTTSQQNACINNLRQIETAKDQYALEHDLKRGALITFGDIGPDSKSGYIKQWPVCPASEKAGTTPRTRNLTENDYDINVIGRNAKCRVVPDKHVLR